jgi:hypothetical protein
MNITKEGNEMKKSPDEFKWELLNKAKIQLSGNEYNHIINLLENALYFINQVPNHKYPCKDFNSSYDLASEISETLKKLKQ